MTHLSDVNFLIGQAEIDSRPLRPFDERVCSFIAECSNAILKSSISRKYPDLAALAFWGRKGNLERLKKNYTDLLTTGIGLGLCFHISPANIPVNFAFSWFFALLAGNANIVRLPSKDFPQVQLFCDMAKEVLENYHDLQSSNALVKYHRDSEATALFSMMANARMIWGGDSTIENLRKIPTMPRCVDICFADRYSIALFSTEAIGKATDKEIRKLAANFYNDTWLVDQNACSSPQFILWQGHDTAARERFWQEVENYAINKYFLQDATAVDKFTQCCKMAINHSKIKECNKNNNLLMRMELEELPLAITALRGIGGIFCEYILNDLEEIFTVINEKIQTITYYGIEPEKFRESAIIARVKGIDRIVPVGKALDIGIVWDGRDLVRELGRKIAVSV